MKKLFTSTLLTVVAVPFLMAAPHGKKAQDQTADSNQTQSTHKTKKAKKHHKKHKGADSNTQGTAAPQQ